MRKKSMRFVSLVMSALMLTSVFQLPIYAAAENMDPMAIPAVLQAGDPDGDLSGRMYGAMSDQTFDQMLQIDSSWGHTLAIQTNGLAIGWGDNSSGQCNIPVDLGQVTAVSAGVSFSLALKTDGTVAAWGSNDWEQCDVPAGLSDVTAISAGGSHGLALKDDGTVVAWGFNESGQCSVPDELQDPATANVVAVAAGSSHSLALKADGTVVAWGSNVWGELDIPAELTDAETANVTAIAAPWGHNLAVREDGTVIAWGNNLLGQCDVPAGLTDVVAIDGSYANSMALISDGTVVCWGGDDVGEFAKDIFAPPAGLTDVIAISSQSHGCAVIKSDYSVTAWGTTGIPEGTTLVPKPKIIYAKIDESNSYVDVYFNMGVFAAGMRPQELSNFRLIFHNNGGEAFSAAFTDLKRTDGSEVVGGENVLRFYIDINGEPTGEETIEIKPYSAVSVINVSGELMDENQTTGPIRVNTSIQGFSSIIMAPDNSYADVTVNMGMYGDDSRSEPVTKDDFILVFVQNDGSATGASVTGVTRVDGTEPAGGETKLRFHIELTGIPSGDETIELRAAAGSVYSPDGTAMSPYRSTGPVKLRSPAPQIVLTKLAPDNSYLDVTFNTGVYGGKDYSDEGEYGKGPVGKENLRLFFIPWGGGAESVSIRSAKAADYPTESGAAELRGGEKTIRLFLDVEGVPTGDETLELRVEAVFSTTGEIFSTDTDGIILPMNPLTLDFFQPELAHNNRYVDINFNSGVYGANDGATPVSAGDLMLLYNKNDGNTENITIEAITKTDSTDAAKASPLSGGEKKVRVFLDLTDPASGREELEIRPADGSSVFSAAGEAMTADKSTGKITLSASQPEIRSARLAGDNSYIDVQFDFGIYGDTGATTAVTAKNFSMSLYRNNGQATAATIRSVRRDDSADEAQASPLEGGESTVRVFIDITGYPSGDETVRVYPDHKSICNELGNTMSPYVFHSTGEIKLNSKLKLVSTSLSDDMTYLDVFFNTGTYGDSGHSSPASLSNFSLEFRQNGGTAENVTIRSIKKNDGETEAAATDLTGGETVLRLFLDIEGSISGTETIELKPDYESPLYSDSGNPIAAGQITKPIHLTAPSPEIVSSRLAPDNRYVDITFNMGVYGGPGHTGGVSGDALKVLLNQNGGDTHTVYLQGVYKPDNENGADASPLTGGEKTIRVFLQTVLSPGGGETIEIVPSNSGDDLICSYSGKAIDMAATTGIIPLNPFPRIIQQKVANDNSYVDVTFSTEVYGDAQQSTPLTSDSFTLTFMRNKGGSMLDVSIKSVKKADSQQEVNASPLTGGEKTVRVFLKTVGVANGMETISINSRDSNSIFDKAGLPIPNDKYVQPVRLSDVPLQIIGAVMAEDNSYMDVHFNAGVYGADDGMTPVTADHFMFSNSPAGVSISSVKQPDSTDEGAASDLSGGETILRFFLDHQTTPDEYTTFTLRLAAWLGGPKVYSVTGVAMGSAQSTGVVKAYDMRIRILSAQVAQDNSYVDVVFNKGIYGDKNGSQRVEASDFTLFNNDPSGTIYNLQLLAIRKTDGTTLESASLPEGGETELRFFLEVGGEPTGAETFTIIANADSVFDAKGYSGFRNSGTIPLASSAPAIVSAVLSEDNKYVDVTFNTGVYGSKALNAPVTAGSFRLQFEQNGGRMSNLTILSAKRPDNKSEQLAQSLIGGEKVIRLFLAWDGTSDGLETIELLPADEECVFSSSGIGASMAQTTGKLIMNSNYPKIVSWRVDDDNRYIDISFSKGIYNEYQNGVISRFFTVTLNEDETVPSHKRLKLISWYIGNTAGTSRIIGGEETIRFWLNTIGESKGGETIEITMHENLVYSIDGAAAREQTTGRIPVNAARPKITSVSGFQTAAKLQYVEVNYNTGVYGDAGQTLPVYPELFELHFNKNGGNASSARIAYITGPDGVPLNGGESSMRFFIDTDGFPDGNETVEIRTRSEGVIYNLSGKSNSAALTTNAIRLVSTFAAVESARMGDSNRYIDVVYSKGLSRYQDSTAPVQYSDFNLTFRKNGGTAKSVKISSVKQDNSHLEGSAHKLQGNERTLRFFLEIVGVPSGQETIEITPVNVYTQDGIPVTDSTGPVNLAGTSAGSWTQLTDGAVEPIGWMSDKYLSNSDTEALILKNDGSIAAPVYSHLPVTPDSDVIAVAAGSGFGIALNRDGTVIGWGDITIPEGLSNVRAIDTSLSKAYLLYKDNTIGFLSKTGQLEKYSFSTPITAISAGNDDHLIILFTDGTVHVTGTNNYGQSSRPGGLANVKAVAAGDGYSMALKHDGTVTGWGRITLPGGLADAAAISASSTGYMVLKSNGTVSLYDLEGNVAAIPENISKLTDIIAISAGNDLYSVLRENGDAMVWTSLNQLMPVNIYTNIIRGTLSQDNLYVDIELIDTKTGENKGFIGANGALRKEDLRINYVNRSHLVSDICITSIKRPDSTNSSKASPIREGDKVARVFLGIKGIPLGTETVEIQPASTYSISTDEYDTLIGSQKTGLLRLKEVPDLRNLSLENRVSAGWQHVLAIKDDGTVLAWGGNEYGQTDVPEDLAAAKQVTAGYYHSAALKSDGTVSVWGDNYYGQCNIPYGLKNIKQISAGGYHTLAVDYEGRVYAWGDNFYGQCDVPQDLTGVIWVAAGGHHSIALKGDGRIVAWGDNYFNQYYGLPFSDMVKAGDGGWGDGSYIPGSTTLSPYHLPFRSHIAAGEDFTVILESSPGTRFAVGNNSTGQLDTLQQPWYLTSMSVGYQHGVALAEDGKVSAWGDNSSGQCDVPEDLTGVMAVSAGAFFSVAIKDNGSIVAWGDNSSGQCDVHVDISAPRIKSSGLSVDNSYVDIVFSEGVYGGPEGSVPISAESFELLFDAGDSLHSTAEVSIKSVKRNDSPAEALASPLTGGETAVRVFLDIEGYAAGTETLELRAKTNSSIYDINGEALSPWRSTGVLTLNKLYELPKNRIHGLNSATSDFWTTRRHFNWYHEVPSEAGGNQILVVGLRCSGIDIEGNIHTVTVNGIPMTHIAANRHGDTQLDFYYLLDADIPEAENYDIQVEYYSDDVRMLDGFSVLLSDLAQMAPEAIVISNSSEKYFEDLTNRTLLNTLSDDAVVVELLSFENEKNNFFNPAVKENMSATLAALRNSTMAVHLAGAAGAVESCFIPNRRSAPISWRHIAIAFRSARYPADKAAEAKAPAYIPPATDSYSKGETIAFSDKDIGMPASIPVQLLQHGDKLIAYSWDNTSRNGYIRMTGDGETWDSIVNAPFKSNLFSAGGKLYAWKPIVGYPVASRDRALLSSVDGKSWSSIGVFDKLDNISFMAANSEDISRTDTTIIALGYYLGAPRDGEPYAQIAYVSGNNGNRWERVVLPFDGANGLIWFGGRFIAWNSREIWSTSDGRTWTRRTHFTSGYITQIFERNNVLLLAGNGLDSDDINLYTSTDGAYWIKAGIIYRDPRITGYNGFTSIAYAQNTYAAAGGSYIAAAQAPLLENVDAPWEFSLYALETIRADQLMSINNRFYTRYEGSLFSSDNLTDWRYESSNSGGGGIFNFRDKAIAASPNTRQILVGYRVLNVDSLSPYINETGVPVEDKIIIGFPEGIKLVGQTLKASVQLINNGTGNIHPISVSCEDGKLILAPTVQLAYNSMYTVILAEGAVRNTANTKANKPFTYSFVTADRSGKPQITSTSLMDGNDVPAEEPVIIRYDRPISEGPNFQNIIITTEEEPGIPLEMRREIVKNSIVLTPLKAFNNRRTYIITLPAACVTDQYGHFSDIWSMKFTVVEDITPPKVIGSLPPNYGERVPQAPTIEVRFDENIKEGVNFNKITLRNIRSSENTEIQVSIPNGTNLDGTPANNTVLIELPAGRTLDLHHTYRVTIPAGAVTDMAGNALVKEFSYIFTEEIQDSSPVLLECNPGDNAGEVDVRSDFTLLFDRPIGEGDNYSSDYGNGQIHYIFRLSCEGYPEIDLIPEIRKNKLTLRHDQPMEYGVTYRLRIPAYSISDKNGLNMITEDINLYFTTERQRISKAFPGQRSEGIKTNSLPEIIFDSPADKGYEFNNIALVKHGADGDERISARLALEGDRLTVAPEDELSPDTHYTLWLPRGAVRFAGSSVSNEYELSFTTGSERAEISDFSFIGTIELLDALFEDDQAVFDATGTYPDAVAYSWDFGDGTPAVTGNRVVHTFRHKGTYRVILTVTDTDGTRYTLSKDIYVIKKADRESTVLDVSPRAPALLNPGDSVNYVLRLSSSNIPMLNQTIQVLRTYPVSEGKASELLTTLKTDKNGMAEYRATLSEAYEDYYITFAYDSISVRRILKNSAEKCDISGYVLNDKGEIMSNVIVSIGHRATVTDASGLYRISDVEHGSYDMVVSAEFHYDYTSNISLYQKGTVKNIVLTKIVYSQEPLIRQISVNNTTSKDFHFLKGIDAEISIEPFVDWKGHEPGTLELRNGNTVLSRIDYTRSFVINARDLTKADRLNVTAYTRDGLKTKSVDVRVHIIDTLPGEFPFDLEPVYIDGKYIMERYINLLPVSTPNITSIPILNGGPVSFFTDPVYAYGEMGVDGSFFVVTSKDGVSSSSYGYYAENNLIQKYLAKKKATSVREKKAIAAKQSKSYMGGVELDSQISATFRWDYDMAQQEWIFDEGTLHLGISVNAWASASYGIPGIPLSITISGDFEVIMDAYLKALNNNGKISYNSGTLDLNHIFIEIYAGVSAYIASAGVYFNGTGAVKVDFPSGDTKYYIDVAGGVRVKFLLWSVEYDYLKYSWGDRSPWLAQSGIRTYTSSLKGGQFSMSTLGNLGVPVGGILPESTDELTPMGRDYLKEQSDWLGGGTSTDSGISTMGRRMTMLADAADQETSRTVILRSNTFPNTEHYVIPYALDDPNGAFMVMVEDDASRSTLNQTRVKYSVYNGSGWSYPEPIGADDYTADFKPVAAATDSGVIAAWENMKSSLAPDSQLGDALAMEEIAVGTYNAAAAAWSNVYNLTSDRYHDHSPKIAAMGDDGILVWIKSRSNDYDSALSDSYICQNDIMFSRWDGSAFGMPQTAAAIDKTIVNASVAFNGDKAIYVFALDEDRNLNTVTDQEIYFMVYDKAANSWSSPEKLTDNIVRDSNPQVCFLNGRAFIIWEQDGNIVYTDNAEAASIEVKTAAADTIMQNSFTMAVKDNHMLSLVGPGSSGSNGTDLYEITYDVVNQLWSKEQKLTEDYSANRSPSAAFTANELITVYNRDIIVDKVNPTDGSIYPTISNKADLRMIARQMAHDLAVVEDEILLSEENPFPGGLTEISAVIANRGSFTEDRVKVAFYAGDPDNGGQQIGSTQVITGKIVPGDSADVTVQWEVPAVLPAQGIYVVVDPENEVQDARRSNNTANLSILRPDLELTKLECLPAENGKYIVTVKVTNVSAADVPGSVVSLYYGNEEGELELIENIAVGALKAGEAAELTYMWTPGAAAFRNGKADLFAIAEIADAASDRISQLAAITLEEESILENNIKMLTLINGTAEPSDPVIDDNDDAGNGINTGTPGNTPATGAIIAKTTVDGNGNVSAVVTIEQINDAVRGVLAEAGKQQTGERSIEIIAEASPDTEALSLTIPGDGLKQLLDAGIGILTISTPVASVTFDAGALSSLYREAEGDVKIMVSKVKAESLSDEARQLAGGRPVFDLSVARGDRIISQFEGNVTVSVPYTARTGEDTDAIVICHIDESGAPRILGNSIYDSLAGRVVFTTRHFSKYAVSYNKVSFRDVAESAWYSKAISFIAARGITAGTGGGNFSPGAGLTRGQFIVMLMRAYGMEPDENTKDNFTDAGATWYTGYLAEAKRLGLSAGVGNNMFAPDREITRQEMFTLLYNVLKTVGQLPEETAAGRPLSSFKDAGDIASWAKDAMRLFAGTGVISGSGGKLSPKDTTTRAEMAQVLYNLLHK